MPRKNQPQGEYKLEPITCDNCHNPIIKTAAMMPTVEKEKVLCLKCADEKFFVGVNIKKVGKDLLDLFRNHSRR